jgi:hypothetical protein
VLTHWLHPSLKFLFQCVPTEFNFPHSWSQTKDDDRHEKRKNRPNGQMNKQFPPVAVPGSRISCSGRKTGAFREQRKTAGRKRGSNGIQAIGDGMERRNRLGKSRSCIDRIILYAFPVFLLSAVFFRGKDQKQFPKDFSALVLIG